MILTRALPVTTNTSGKGKLSETWASQSFGERLSAALKLSGPENRQIAYRLTEHHFGGIGDFVAVEPLNELDPGPYRLQIRAKRQEDLQKVVGDEDLFFNVTSSPSAPPPSVSSH
jgi:hypothetical protein